MSERRGRIHEKHDLSKTRRCELLDVPRSSAYYRRESVSEADLAVMRLIDEIHLQLPFYGSRGSWPTLHLLIVPKRGLVSQMNVSRNVA